MKAADISILIPAAGLGERLGLGPKASLALHGRPVLHWLVDKARPLGAEILVACADGMDAPEGCVRVPGGATRQDSVARLAEAATRPWCLLWDAASPFASRSLAQQVLAAARAHGAATACLVPEVPCYTLGEDTLATPFARGEVGMSQTPQAYAAAALRAVHARAAQEGWRTQSTVQLMLQAGHDVAWVPSEKLNIKLTTPEDWQLAQGLAHLLQS